MLTPLYGRFNFGTQISLDMLIERLQQVSYTFLDKTPFHAYLVTTEGQTYYGLKEDELRQLFSQNEGSVQTLSTAASTPERKVVRIHIHFDPFRGQAKGQFVIAGESKKENEEIQALLLGNPLKVSRVIRSKEEQRPQPGSEILPQQYLAFADASDAFQTGVITLSDNFFFDRNLSIYGLLALLDELSDRFMDYRSFHAQLETSDGDFYFDIQRDELRYMFNQRRHTLLTLFLNATNRDGHWIDMMLSFHPLATGPNAIVEITAPGSMIDDITGRIWEVLAVESEINFPENVEESFSFDPYQFSISEFIGLVNRISHRYVFQIPPVADLTTKGKQVYQGLSFFQLNKRFNELGDNVQQLQVGITQVITGQNFQLTLDFAPEAEAHLVVRLGDGEKHLAIRQLVQAWFQTENRQVRVLSPILTDVPRQAPDLTRPEEYCFLSMPEDGQITQNLRYEVENALATLGIASTRDTFLQGAELQQTIRQTNFMIIAIEGNSSDVLHKVGLAHILHKKVILLVAKGEVLPPELQKFPHLIFHGNKTRIDQFINRLTSLVRASTKNS